MEDSEENIHINIDSEENVPVDIGAERIKNKITDWEKQNQFSKFPLLFHHEFYFCQFFLIFSFNTAH